MGRLLDKLTFGAARRRRRMARLLDQLDRMPVGQLPTTPGRGSSYRPPRRRLVPGLRAMATLLVWVVIVGGVIYLARLGNKHSASASPKVATPSLSGSDTNHSNSKLTTNGSQMPPAGVGEQASRVLPAPTVPAGSGGYTFIQTTKIGPVSYDPCRPIHYVTRDHDTPAGGKQAVQQAIAAVSKATGLQFIDDGSTTEVPTLKRNPYQPARYGDKWAPVLIAWTDSKETPSLAGIVAGRGGSESVWGGKPDSTKDDSVYVTGTVFLDTPDLTSVFARPDGMTEVTAILKHELGHLVGLNHVHDRSELMNAQNVGLADYGPGDLRGLSIEGRGSCHPEL